jgi:hypothetical protein
MWHKDGRSKKLPGYATKNCVICKLKKDRGTVTGCEKNVHPILCELCVEQGRREIAKFMVEGDTRSQAFKKLRKKYKRGDQGQRPKMKSVSLFNEMLQNV